MTKRSSITPAFVEFIPERLEDGVLYISREYKTAIHRCACGCGAEIVTPLVPTEWSLRTYGDSVTLYPSIGNWSYPCRSHYWIKNNRIVWAGAMSQAQINRGRAMDRMAKDAYFHEEKAPQRQRPAAFFSFVSDFFKRFFK